MHLHFVGRHSMQHCGILYQTTLRVEVMPAVDKIPCWAVGGLAHRIELVNHTSLNATREQQQTLPIKCRVVQHWRLNTCNYGFARPLSANKYGHAAHTHCHVSIDL